MEEFMLNPPGFHYKTKIKEKLERSSDVTVVFPFHYHPLYTTKSSTSKTCVGCDEASVDGVEGYFCDDKYCKRIYVHKNCIEVTNPSHPTHPLSIMINVSHRKCCVCEESVGRYVYSYPYSGEVFVCFACAHKEPYIDPKKSHEHPLFVLIKAFNIFACDACGVIDASSCLCLCIPCRFTIHRDCVNLPRVVCINRHDHRISHVPRLSPGEWDCGVCHKTVNGTYGAYSCSSCSFVAHSRCAARPDLWDGIELEGVPEDAPEDILPFKVIEEGVIKHFSHEHYLRLITKDDIVHDKNKQCYACVLPIFSDPCYVCIQCEFILHETCANFPRKKRHMSHKKQFTLFSETQGEYGIVPFRCEVCNKFCSGFSYVADNTFRIDVRCVSIYDGYIHKSQPHLMLVASDNGYSEAYNICSHCGTFGLPELNFTEHDHFSMCYKCATMPAQVMNKYDVHPLSLRFSENASGNYWCEKCEKRINPEKWFYTCDECCTTLHTKCVVRKHSYLRVGSIFFYKNFEVEVVSNEYASRPKCYECSSLITKSPILKSRSKYVFFCSIFCTRRYCD